MNVNSKTYGYCYKKNRTKKARKLKKKVRLPKTPEQPPLKKPSIEKNTIKKFRKKSSYHLIKLN